MAFGIQQIHAQDINPNTPVGIDLPLNESTPSIIGLSIAKNLDITSAFN